MRIAFGADEATTLTDRLTAELAGLGHQVHLIGAPGGAGDEWADVGAEVGREVGAGSADLGIVCCWSGTGVSIAANKVPGARAALCADAETARLARKYNHANVLVLSLRATSDTVGREILAAFLDEPYGQDDFDLRNVARVDQLDHGA